MAEKIIMPKQGLQMTEGTIIEWKKKEGDLVRVGETLFEIETDKLNIDIDSPATGTLLAILRQEGDTVPITEIIGVIGAPGEDISGFLHTSGGALKSKEAAAAADVVTVSKKIPSTVISTSDVGKEGKYPSGKLFITPRAKKLAREQGIPLTEFMGTGPEGLIIERDVKNYQHVTEVSSTPLARKTAAQTGQDLESVVGTGPRGKIYSTDVQAQLAVSQPLMAEEPIEIVPVKGMRKVISERMRSSLDEAAQAVHRIDIDMSEAVRIREIFKTAEKKISFNDIIIRAVAEAIKRNPVINRQFRSESEIVQFSDVHIGVAVALETGLIVPVIKHANRLGLQGIHAETKRLAEAARSNTLQPDDLSGGRFTVSNLGMYGIDSFTAIINQPESCILAVGTVKDRAVVVDKEIVIRPICQISLTYDHRIIDGAPAAEFLQSLQKIMNNPYLLI
ncbi:MAG: 2-oxo acid dehydrogenase subunit E2 [Bacteroidetes bacterium]|nr:2-oxo acid dehydrogenase subunit E2 [Bacteroidota bacterium]